MKHIHLFFVKLIIFIFLLITIGGLSFVYIKSRFAKKIISKITPTPTKVLNTATFTEDFILTTSKIIPTDTLNNNVKKSNEELITLFNSKRYGEIFDDYYSSSVNLGISKSEYVEAINEYIKRNKIIKVTLEILNITNKEKMAIITRKLTYCFDTECRKKREETASIEWILEGSRWYTAQEVPTCVREAPYDTSSSYTQPGTRYKYKNSHITIITTIECDMFPFMWRIEPINGEVSSVTKKEATRSLTALEQALNKYPIEVLEDNLKKIYIVKDLTFFDTPYGGTNTTDRVYLSNDGYSETYNERIFHHEFSSVLLRKYPAIFDEEEWKRINPKGFIYGTGGVDAIKEGRASEDFDEKRFSKGFLNEYAESSLENDFNEIAQNIFKSDEGFWEIVDTHEKIKKKVEMVIDFYQSLSPLFTETYFRSL